MERLNRLIAEIIGLEQIDPPNGPYRRRDNQYGFAGPCPNFFNSASNQRELREKMSLGGWLLHVAHNPADFEKNQGRTSTATFRNGNLCFDSTQPDEYTAICEAALLAFREKR